MGATTTTLRPTSSSPATTERLPGTPGRPSLGLLSEKQRKESLITYPLEQLHSFKNRLALKLVFL